MMLLKKINSFAALAILCMQSSSCISLKTRLNLPIETSTYSSCATSKSTPPKGEPAWCWGYDQAMKPDSSKVSVKSCADNYDLKSRFSLLMVLGAQRSFCAARFNFNTAYPDGLDLPLIDALAVSLGRPDLSTDAISYKTKFCEWFTHINKQESLKASLPAQALCGVSEYGQGLSYCASPKERNPFCWGKNPPDPAVKDCTESYDLALTGFGYTGPGGFCRARFNFSKDFQNGGLEQVGVETLKSLYTALRSLHNPPTGFKEALCSQITSEPNVFGSLGEVWVLRDLCGITFDSIGTSLSCTGRLNFLENSKVPSCWAIKIALAGAQVCFEDRNSIFTRTLTRFCEARQDINDHFFRLKKSHPDQLLKSLQKNGYLSEEIKTLPEGGLGVDADQYIQTVKSLQVQVVSQPMGESCTPSETLDRPSCWGLGTLLKGGKVGINACIQDYDYNLFHSSLIGTQRNFCQARYFFNYLFSKLNQNSNPDELVKSLQSGPLNQRVGELKALPKSELGIDARLYIRKVKSLQEKVIAAPVFAKLALEALELRNRFPLDKSSDSQGLLKSFAETVELVKNLYPDYATDAAEYLKLCSVESQNDSACNGLFCALFPQYLTEKSSFCTDETGATVYQQLERVRRIPARGILGNSVSPDGHVGGEAPVAIAESPTAAAASISETTAVTAETKSSTSEPTEPEPSNKEAGNYLLAERAPPTVEPVAATTQATEQSATATGESSPTETDSSDVNREAHASDPSVDPIKTSEAIAEASKAEKTAAHLVTAEESLTAEAQLVKTVALQALDLRNKFPLSESVEIRKLVAPFAKNVNELKKFGGASLEFATRAREYFDVCYSDRNDDPECTDVFCALFSPHLQLDFCPNTTKTVDQALVAKVHKRAEAEDRFETERIAKAAKNALVKISDVDRVVLGKAKETLKNNPTAYTPLIQAYLNSCVPSHQGCKEAYCSAFKDFIDENDMICPNTEKESSALSGGSTVEQIETDKELNMLKEIYFALALVGKTVLDDPEAPERDELVTAREFYRTHAAPQALKDYLENFDKCEDKCLALYCAAFQDSERCPEQQSLSSDDVTPVNAEDKDGEMTERPTEREETSSGKENGPSNLALDDGNFLGDMMGLEGGALIDRSLGG